MPILRYYRLSDYDVDNLLRRDDSVSLVVSMYSTDYYSNLYHKSMVFGSYESSMMANYKFYLSGRCDHTFLYRGKGLFSVPDFTNAARIFHKHRKSIAAVFNKLNRE